MGDSSDSHDVSVDAQNAAIVDYTAFENYVRKAATILLPEDDVVDIVALNLALSDKSNQDCIKKFLSDPQVQSLYMQRSCTKGKFVGEKLIFPMYRWTTPIHQSIAWPYK